MDLPWQSTDSSHFNASYCCLISLYYQIHFTAPVFFSLTNNFSWDTNSVIYSDLDRWHLPPFFHLEKQTLGIIMRKREWELYPGLSQRSAECKCINGYFIFPYLGNSLFKAPSPRRQYLASVFTPQWVSTHSGLRDFFLQHLNANIEFVW